MRKAAIAWVCALALVVVTACSGKPWAAGSYPAKPITVVAPSGAGGGWDLTARALVKALRESKLVNQSMSVENRPGGGGTVFLAEYATQDRANPYKLFVNSPPILINHLKKEGNSPFGYRDTTPLAQLTEDYGAYVVRADSPYRDLRSVLQVIQTHPERLTVAGGSAPGSMDHLIAILPVYYSGISPKKMKYVSYDGGGEAMAALLGGNADLIATDASSVGEYLRAGKVRVLAVTAPHRLSGELKAVPTLKELGINTEFTIWRGVFGPKQMPPQSVKYWQKQLKALSDHPVWKRELAANHWIGRYRDAQSFQAFLEEQDQQIRTLLKALGMAKP